MGSYHDEQENFCRNPDNDSGGLWCYTTDPDKRWEYCAPPICEDENTSVDIGCVDEDDVLGKNYTGGQRTTKSGRTCQHWCSTSPHYHRQESPDLKDNFCRNPDNEPGGPWCYTTDPAKRWEYCGTRRWRRSRRGGRTSATLATTGTGDSWMERTAGRTQRLGTAA